MVYLDSNILIYSFVHEDENKQAKSIKLIKDLMQQNELLISPLVIQESAYVMSRLGVNKELISQNIDLYSEFCLIPIEARSILAAKDLAYKTDSYRSFNDALHVVLAELFCDKLITFDKGFKSFASFTPLNIEIL